MMNFTRYEEQSLGVFEMPPDDEDEEPTFGMIKDPRERFGKYFGWHLRRQVAFDIWWLVSAIFLICVIERTKIMDDDNAPWFNLFRISVSYLLLSSSMSASGANSNCLTTSIRVGLRIRRYRSKPRYSNAKLLLFWSLRTTVQAYCYSHHGQRTSPWLACRHRQSQ